jgi:hypothetical protein
MTKPRYTLLPNFSRVTNSFINFLSAISHNVGVFLGDSKLAKNELTTAPIADRLSIQQAFFLARYIVAYHTKGRGKGLSQVSIPDTFGLDSTDSQTSGVLG